MDPPTHALLGAAIGRALYGQELGRRASWCGALGCVLPDLDLIVLPFTGPLGEWRYHRGLTHSLWFGPVVGALLGHSAWRMGARKGDGEPPSRSVWIGLFILAISVHPLLDAFTSYGTQLLWPFSRRRFALDAVAIVDLIYTAPLIVALVMGGRSASGRRRGRLAAAVALGFTSAYLFYGLWLNGRAEARARRQLAAEGVGGAEVRCYPTLLQPWLRRVVARAPEEVRVGWLSMWRPRAVEWRSFRPQDHPLIDRLRQTPEGRMFEWFAAGQTSARAASAARGWVAEIEDIRYGYPGPPDEGLWGVRGSFDREGRLTAPVKRFNRPVPGGVRTQLAHLWRATFD